MPFRYTGIQQYVFLYQVHKNEKKKKLEIEDFVEICVRSPPCTMRCHRRHAPLRYESELEQDKVGQGCLGNLGIPLPLVCIFKQRASCCETITINNYFNSIFKSVQDNSSKPFSAKNFRNTTNCGIKRQQQSVVITKAERRKMFMAFSFVHP